MDNYQYFVKSRKTGLFEEYSAKYHTIEEAEAWKANPQKGGMLINTFNRELELFKNCERIKK